MLKVPRAVGVPSGLEVDLGFRVEQDSTFRSLPEVLGFPVGFEG